MRWFVLNLCFVLGAAEISVLSPTTQSVSRIIGGTSTTIETYPFTVQVMYSNSLICGGSILTTRHVLSAAHCFVDNYGITLSPTYFSVRVGSTYLNTDGVVHRVSAIIVHESYNVPVRDNDIAVLVLTTAISYTTGVQAAFIPPQNYEVADNSSLIHVGWGRTNVNVAALASVLQHVTVRAVNRVECATRYAWLASMTGDAYPITTSMICAGLLDVGGADACQGDSGGPLIYGNVVVGLTSWGLGCGEPSFPGVNTRVASYTNWINNTVVRYSKGSPMKDSSLALLLISLISSMTIMYKS